MDRSKVNTIRISDWVKGHIQEEGKFGETASQVLERLLKAQVKFPEKATNDDDFSEMFGLTATPVKVTPVSPVKKKASCPVKKKASSSNKKKRTHVIGADVTPRESWIPIIMQILLKAPGYTLTGQEVTKIIIRDRHVALRADDTDLRHKSNQCVWRKNLAFAVSDLRENGHMVPWETSGRGNWTLTPKGVKRAEKIQKDMDDYGQTDIEDLKRRSTKSGDNSAV